jgi:hypothetical protein
MSSAFAENTFLEKSFQPSSVVLVTGLIKATHSRFSSEEL